MQGLVDLPRLPRLSDDRDTKVTLSNPDDLSGRLAPRVRPHSPRVNL